VLLPLPPTVVSPLASDQRFMAEVNVYRRSIRVMLMQERLGKNRETLRAGLEATVHRKQSRRQDFKNRLTQQRELSLTRKRLQPKAPR
jgi:phage gp37-like protein